MSLREAAQQALEALESLQGGCTDSNDGTVEAITVWCPEVIAALRAALEQPEQEPVEPLTQGERSLLWTQLFGPNLAVNKRLPYVSITVFDKIVEAVERKRGITTPRREWKGDAK